MRIAIVGTGIAGNGAAYALATSTPHDITVYEREQRTGGHSATVAVDYDGTQVPVDTGFIVYNETNYPNLTALLAYLGVETSASSMSFSVSIAEGRREYSGKHLNGLFGQRRNIIRPGHWQLVADILRFFREAERQAAMCGDDISIGEFLERFGYSRVFIEDHILPVSAAIWSTPSRGMLAFPAKTFVQFFSNHGLLQVSGRPIWRTVNGGSQEYVRRLVADARMETRVGCAIAGVRRDALGAELVMENGHRQRFDQVIFACHADEALALLLDPTPEEGEILSAFRYTTNRAVLHTDRSFMPRRKHLWSSWNYLRAAADGEDLSLSYWMNRLQPLATDEDVFVTLNPHRGFAPGTVQYETAFQHPLFDAAAVTAQRQLWRIQGRQSTWFAGAWMGYGFHEDGLQAGLEVAERIGPLSRPWHVSDSRGRIAHAWAEGDVPRWAAE